MEIPARIHGEIEEYAHSHSKDIDEYSKLIDAGIFGYNLSKEELEEKDKEIERLTRILNMQQESGTI